MAYTPAGNLTSSASLAHGATVSYRKRGLDRLMKKFVFRDICQDDMLPRMSGRTVQFYRYTNPSAATTATTEGTVGSSGTFASRILQASVSQYTSFITVSDLAMDLFIDPVLQSAAELLGYQGGLSVDTITRNIIDAEIAATAVTPLAGSNGYLKVNDLRVLRHTLQSLDVQPFEDNEFTFVCSPYISYDIVSDPAAGGLADIFKYTNPGGTPLVKYEDRGTVSHVAATKIIESTNVKVTAGTPNVYASYFFGKGAVGAVDLEGRGPNKVKDPSKQRFNVKVIKGGSENASIADPEGVIGGAVSYNFVFTVVVLDGPAQIGGTYRFRTISTASSIG